ncbi:MAG: hypothetical protein R3E66_22805 [bacterium]
MPLISRVFIKTGVLYFLLASTSLVVDTWVSDGVFWMTPTWLHLFVVGWITHLIFGVAGWMFPKQSKELPRGRTAVGFSGYALLNVGLVLRALWEPCATVSRPMALLGSAITQWVGAALLVVWIWPRVKGK